MTDMQTPPLSPFFAPAEVRKRVAVMEERIASTKEALVSEMT